MRANARSEEVNIKSGTEEVSYFVTEPQKYLPTLPLIVLSDGVPFYDGNMTIIKWILDTPIVSVETIDSYATDLCLYVRFLEENGLDHLKMPRMKLKRPTYKFLQEMNTRVHNGDIAVTRANRVMGYVVKFYKNMFRCGLINRGDLQNKPYEEFEKRIQYETEYGGKRDARVLSHDLKIKGAKSSDPTRITDGDSLKPMLPEHQIMMLEYLKKSSNVEFGLIVLFSLFSGARIQTATTLRLKSIDINELDKMSEFKEVPLRVGPDTGVDTKYNKNIILRPQVWLIKKLVTYRESDRAENRRKASVMGENDFNYLFLTKSGNPYYIGKRDIEELTKYNPIRNPKKASGIRQAWSKMRKELQIKDVTWDYHYHDSRATYGMNLLDRLMEANKVRPENKKLSNTAILNHIMQRMGHKNIAVTQQYLNYRRLNDELIEAQTSWDKKIVEAIRWP